MPRAPRATAPEPAAVEDLPLPPTPADNRADASAFPLPLVRSTTGAPPLPRRASPLARRFQQVCAAMIAEALAGEELVQLEYGSLICIDIEPGLDQRRLAEAMGIDPSNAS